MWGRATSQSNRMCPGPRLPISQTTASVRSVARTIVSGRPTSLLKEAWLLTTSSVRESTAAVKSFVNVFPVEPVIPTTVASRRERASRASRRRAAAGSSTSIRGPGGSSPLPFAQPRRTTAAVAPRRKASPTKRWPSIRSPRRAKKRSPGPARRLSTVAPVTVPPVPVGRTLPATASAASASVRGITARPCPSRPAPPMPLPGRRTRWFDRRTAARSHVPFPR